MRAIHGDRGAVTVEAALALCSLVAVMVLVVASVAAAAAHLRCLDAAREAARLVARGEPERAREVAAIIAPRNAVIEVRVRADEVEVRVSAAAVPGLPVPPLTATALGVLEPAALVSTGPSAGAPPPPGEFPVGSDDGGPGRSAGGPP